MATAREKWEALCRKEYDALRVELARMEVRYHRGDTFDEIALRHRKWLEDRASEFQSAVDALSH